MIKAKDTRTDYGIDAPVVVRNLFLAGTIGTSLWIVTQFLAWSAAIRFPHWILVLVGMGFTTGIGCALMSVWMIWESKVGKMKSRDRLLDRIDWRGDERVLDVGCGAGLILIGAAKRLNTGKATGIDIWQTEDLSGNSPEVALENARREGVSDRVDVQTADVRELPFPDGTFDIVVSRAVIHNLYSAPEREKAIREIARVLKPSGRAVIEDIRHLQDYSRIFSQNGCRDVQRAGSVAIYLFCTLITFGSVRPATLLVRKSP